MQQKNKHNKALCNDMSVRSCTIQQHANLKSLHREAQIYSEWIQFVRVLDETGETEVLLHLYVRSTVFCYQATCHQPIFTAELLRIVKHITWKADFYFYHMPSCVDV